MRLSVQKRDWQSVPTRELRESMQDHLVAWLGQRRAYEADKATMDAAAGAAILICTMLPALGGMQ